MKDTRAYTRTRGIVIMALAAFTVAALIALTLVVTGVVPFRHADNVPCNDLTTYRQVQAAVDGKADTITRIRDVGRDVDVVPVIADCQTSAGKLGYMRVTYGSDRERDAIQDILGSGDGLGVYVILSRK